MDGAANLKRGGRWGLVLLSVWMLGCTHISAEYRHAVHRWQRHAEVFDFTSFRAELIWDAMLLTPEVQGARLEREAQLRHLSISQTQQYIPAAWNQDGTLFFINFFAPRDAKDLLSAEGYWHLELRDAAGHTYQASDVAQIPITPMTRKLFPFIHTWAKTYVVRFPANLQGPLTLTLFGLNATSELVWQSGQ